MNLRRILFSIAASIAIWIPASAIAESAQNADDRLSQAASNQQLTLA